MVLKQQTTISIIKKRLTSWLQYQHAHYFTQSLPTYFVNPRFLRTFAFSKNGSPNLHIIKNI